MCLLIAPSPVHWFLITFKETVRLIHRTSFISVLLSDDPIINFFLYTR